MPKFAKGSEEAKNWAKKMADARAIKAGREPVDMGAKVSLTMMSKPELVIPEWFAMPTKKGYKLVNPITQERNLSQRKGELSFKIVRRPIEEAVVLDGSPDLVPLSKFSPRDRDLIKKYFEKIEVNSAKEVKQKPAIPLGEVEERGRPEKLPKNIKINKERRDAKKAAEKASKPAAAGGAPTEPKSKGRPTKYTSEEERKAAKKEQDRKSNAARDARKRQARLAAAAGGTPTGEGLSQDNIVLVMSEEFDDLIKSETDADLRMLLGELTEQLREAKMGKQSHSTIRDTNEIRKKMALLAKELENRGAMTGAGRERKPSAKATAAAPSQIQRTNELAARARAAAEQQRLIDENVAQEREFNRLAGLVSYEEPPPSPPPQIRNAQPVKYTSRALMTIRPVPREPQRPPMTAAERQELLAARQAFIGETALQNYQRIMDTPKPSGSGLDGGFEDIKWGSFSKQFKEYNRTAKKPIKDLEKFANMIMKTPEKFQQRTIKRARFYLNVLMKKEENKISTEDIEMPKKSKMSDMDESGMGLYASNASIGGTGMMAGMGMFAGEGCGGANGCGMCGGAIYNPTNDPEIAKLNDHIRMIMGHHLQLGMAGKGIFGDIGNWFKKAGRTINQKVIQPVGKAFSKGGPLETIGKKVAGFAIRKGLPALANLASDAIGQPEIGAALTGVAGKAGDKLASSLGVGVGGKGMMAGMGAKKPNAWIELVKKVQRDKGVSYKEAMSIASAMKKGKN